MLEMLGLWQVPKSQFQIVANLKGLWGSSLEFRPTLEWLLTVSLVWIHLLPRTLTSSKSLWGQSRSTGVPGIRHHQEIWWSFCICFEIFYFIILMYMYMVRFCLGMCPWRSEVSHAPEPGITGGCETPNMLAGNRNWVFCKRNVCS